MTLLCEQGKKSTAITISSNGTAASRSDNYIALDALPKASFRILLTTPSDQTHLLFDSYVDAHAWYSQLCLAGGLCLGCGEPCVRLDRIRPSAMATSVLQPSETTATSPPTHCPPGAGAPHCHVVPPVGVLFRVLLYQYFRETGYGV